MRKYPTAECLACETIFEPLHSRDKYCSHECSIKYVQGTITALSNGRKIYSRRFQNWGNNPDFSLKNILKSYEGSGMELLISFDN